MSALNLLADIPEQLPTELLQPLLTASSVRIERIISKGHTSPAQGWYDQDEHEWVMVLQGAGELEFEDGRKLRLQAYDYVNIPAHTRHKVSWTESRPVTVWLVVFYR